jgi:hypothetical protein
VLAENLHPFAKSLSRLGTGLGLEAQQKVWGYTIPPERVYPVLAEMKQILDTDDIQAKHMLSRRLAVHFWIVDNSNMDEARKEKGESENTLSPYCSADLYQAPPGRYFIKVRTIVYAALE